MQIQTVTRATESDFDPGSIYEVLADPSRLPQLAPIFADTIEPLDGSDYNVTKNGETFRVEVVVNRSAGTVDYIRQMANNKRGGAYIRVTPRPLGGSTITITVPVGPNATPSDIGAVLDQELGDLLRLVR
jgi:hypothetical protein